MADILNNRKEITTVTPMMQQYLLVKEQYEGFILFYRLGDFYECFFDDALIASKELELTLTSRDCGDGKRAAMCGVPFHKSDAYVARLVDHGFKVAICEQIGDPKASEGLVKREVVRVVTPGTVTDASVLTSSNNNFLASICYGISGIGVAFADVSTGDTYATYLGGEDAVAMLQNELAAYQPSEIVINIAKSECAPLMAFIDDRLNALVNDNQKKLFSYERSRELLRSVFAAEAERLNEPEIIMACGALIGYIKETQMSDVTFAKDINVYSRGQYLELDYNTRRNLELVESMRNKEKRGSLLWVLDKTTTSMGARLLKQWLLRPLLNPVAIMNRQSIVKDLYSNMRLREDLRELLSLTLDLERLTARVVYGTANAKDLRAICTSIQRLPEIKSMILQSNCDKLSAIGESIDTLDDLCELLTNAIVDEPPFSVREGGMIRDGFNSEIDYYRDILNGGSDIMQNIEKNERELTGIKTLKVNYNKVFGYFIEVTKMYVPQVPDRYIRKQTLTNCERYITDELKKFEVEILSAGEKLVELEYEIFSGLRAVISDNVDRIRMTANMIAELDVYLSLAHVASKNGYVCPEVDISKELVIKDGRHPVVEKFVTDSYFVPNDTLLDTTANRMIILTGPNMAGKSTYMRQVAIITIMAQIGSFVPAREARIGIVDKVFTRVGASDDLASGQSTFMLEMNEVATILKNATRSSLIIYDEVGRGTSTYDGMAIARAVVEYTSSKKIGAKTLFATHYHELTDMENDYDGILNYNIAAKKRGDSITFLRKIVRGGTDDSYGIEVAKLAGVPNEVVKRAREILTQIESGDAVSVKPGDKKKEENSSFDMLSVITNDKHDEAIEKIRKCDINTLTPIEAMNLLFEIKRDIDN